jgi:prolipoprotein diacylglyceryltransferase
MRNRGGHDFVRKTGSRLREGVNVRLDSLACPTLTVRGKSYPAFHVCGVAGLGCALATACLMARLLGLSPWVVCGVAAAGVAAFLFLAMAVKVLTGGERLTFYHHAAAVLASAAALTSAAGLPVLPYLDVTALGLGAFLACGRVGCLLVGCCHGRPHAWGVRYGAAHAAEGFAARYVGVRLFPVQACEALWALGVVAAGTVVALGAGRPGEALAWCAVCYAAGRFCLEFMRGDAERPFWLGFSESQWISLAVLCVVVRAELGGVIALHTWHASAALCVACAMLVTRVAGRARDAHPSRAGASRGRVFKRS